MWCALGNRGVFPSDWGPVLERMGIVSVLQTTTANMSLLDNIKSSNKLGILTDWFLSGVFQSVNTSDDISFRNFFMDKNKVLCYRRSDDVRARICVPADCCEALLRAAHGDSVLTGHPEIDRTYAAVSYDAYYWSGLFADVAHFLRSCNV